MLSVNARYRVVIELTMQVCSNLSLSPVTVSEELLLVVEKLFAGLRGELLVLRYINAGKGGSVSNRDLGA